MRAAAHPRAGGENQLNADGVFAVGGSSPRWRGKLAGGTIGARHIGLIPALAGKTVAWCFPESYSEAHPRAGGENLDHGCEGGAHIGSSPRWRGKRMRLRLACPCLGLIPALAGKTLRVWLTLL